MKTEKKDIGERIKDSRRKAKLKQKELADLLGVGITTISGYEHGQNYPTPASLAKIAKALNVTLDYLITGAEVIESGGTDRPPASYKAKRVVLSDQEHMIIEAYRKGDDTDKLSIISQAVGIIKRT